MAECIFSREVKIVQEAFQVSQEKKLFSLCFKVIQRVIDEYGKNKYLTTRE